MGRSKEPEHTPASPEAIAQGCTCDPVINSGGRGRLSPSGQVAFMPNKEMKISENSVSRSPPSPRQQAPIRHVGRARLRPVLDSIAGLAVAPDNFRTDAA